MKKFLISLASLFTLAGFLLAACQQQPGQTSTTSGNVPSSASPGERLKVLAVESFLGDIAQNVAGDRLKVQTLMPLGLDPHAFVPTPQDVVKIANSQVLIANGAGVESWLQRVLENAGGQRQVIEASSGLVSRQPREGEQVELSPGVQSAAGSKNLTQTDPHFWLDPLSVVKYVENIRDGLIQADPAGKDVYTQNATAYIDQLKQLDAWINTQVALIPPERRLLVTNHESFGYFADRYGFKIIGTILPSVSTDASPSAQQLARLVDHIKATGASAIFLETGSNPQLADQVASETGVKVVTDLYTHSISPPGGKAPTYIDMIKYDVNTIVEALK